MIDQSGQLKHIGRRSAISLVLYALGQLSITAVGVALIVGAAREASAYGEIFGSLVLGIGLACMAATLLELLHRCRGHGAALGTTPGGTPATVFSRARWVPWISGSLLATVSGCAWAAAAVAFSHDQALPTAILLVFGGACMAYLVALLFGRVPAGGVFLTPRGITSAKDGAWWEVNWDDVADVLSTEPMVVVLRVGATIDRGKTAPLGWRAGGPMFDGLLAVQTRYLTKDAEELSELLLALRDRPDLRRALGTEASLQLDIVRASV